jgi:glycosyltransferase involved in cell wall biosynthesis
MPKYSICITNYNCGPTMRSSLASILGQLDDRFEIVVVDNLSTDGSKVILKEFETGGKLKLIEKKSSRGEGLQTAFENATGEYIVSGLDLGDTYRPRFDSFLDFYHDMCEGKLLHGINEAVIVAPRYLIEKLGGWRDLQRSEGWDLWSRAAKAGVYRWTIFLLTEARNRSSYQDQTEAHPERKTFFGKYWHLYQVYRDSLRLGRKLFTPGSHVGPDSKLVEFFARASLPFYKSYESGPSDFTSQEPEYFVDSRDWWLEDATRRGDKMERERVYYKKYLTGFVAQPYLQ